MAQLSLPSFETLNKLSGWAAEQSMIALAVLTKGPEQIYAEAKLASPNNLASAFRFVSFVILLTMIITAPIDIVIFKLDLFDAGNALVSFSIKILLILIFSVGMHLCAKILGGMGSFQNNLAAMFYASVYYLVFRLLDYMYLSYSELLIKAGQGTLKESEFLTAASNTPSILVVILLQLSIIVYIGIKLVPLVRSVHAMGRFRSLLALGLNCILYFYAFHFLLEPISTGINRMQPGSASL